MVSVRYILKKAAVIYFFTFVIVLPLMCHEWFYSIYFLESYFTENARKIVNQKNIENLKKAKAYFNSTSPQVSKKYYKTKLNCDHINFIIMVVTNKRTWSNDDEDDSDDPVELGYLTQAMHSLDLELRYFHPDECNAVMLMCNVNHPISDHVEATRLGNYFVMANVTPYQDHNVPENGRSKELQDKIKCFESANHLKYDYFLMIEDDAIPNRNFISILKSLIKSQVESKIILGEKSIQNSRWAYLNLHFPDKWLGYSTEINSFCELIAYGLIGGSVGCTLSYFVKLRQRYTLIYVLSAVYFVLFMFAIGRQSMMNFNSKFESLYRVIPAYGCCTPATLYPAKEIPEIVEYLKTVHCHDKYGIDLALSDYCDIKKLKKYLSSPNLFKHIGMFSGLNGKKDAIHFVNT